MLIIVEIQKNGQSTTLSKMKLGCNSLKWVQQLRAQITPKRWKNNTSWESPKKSDIQFQDNKGPPQTNKITKPKEISLKNI